MSKKRKEISSENSKEGERVIIVPRRRSTLGRARIRKAVMAVIAERNKR
ncbi:MAG: hypothetical protein ABIF11_07935 [Nitrospirota bacterium]